MPAIIPIAAFADNYIWLLREGRAAAVVDPGDAAPVAAYLERETSISARFSGHPLESRIAVFAEIKAWKNAC
jgi:glyoxylase-like metal-dependent hydrolase (beta-lactamase superfamily II)